MIKKITLRRSFLALFLSVIIVDVLGISNFVQATTRNVTSQSVVSQPIVVIDPGHGGFDPGAIGPTGSKEKDNALAVALRLGKKLQNRGIKVIYTRTTDNISWPKDETKNLQCRVNISNSNKATLFISIHNNASSIASAYGVETYYYANSSKGKILAGDIQQQTVKTVKSIDRGIKTANYYVLKNTNAVAVLAELGYITNKSEEAKLKSPYYQDLYAQSLSIGILKYFNK